MDNLDLMRKRLEYQGGVHQEDRMIKDKWRTLQRALKYSYQGCSIQMVQPHDAILSADGALLTAEGYDYPHYPASDPADIINLDGYDAFKECRALINPDKVKQDYDDKILSVDYDARIGPGDVFEWKKTDTYWIVYLEEITEDAYFRGEIRRCRYKIKFKANGEYYSTWAAIRGPVETALDSIQKNQVRIDNPNWSLNILIPQNEQTLAAFDRYSEFLFQGKCWKVEAVDTISMRNIIEVSAQEDYINLSTDDTANELKEGLVIEPQDPTPDSGIAGSTFIIPKTTETYSVESEGGTWSILEKNVPVKLCVTENNVATLSWNRTTSGQFTLSWTDGKVTKEKVIVVESLY